MAERAKSKGKGARAEWLAERTDELMGKCSAALRYLEMNPATNPAYTALMEEAARAHAQAARAWLKCWEDPYEANPPIALALTCLDHLRGRLDAMLADERAKAEEAKRRAEEAERKADERQKATMDAIEELRGRLPKRADFGGKHATRGGADGPRAWKSAEDVAADFNKAAFKPLHGKRKVGTCTEATVNRWDADHPDFEHRSDFGYYAELRRNADLKEEYHKVLAAWIAYYDAYREWNRKHPDEPFRLMKRTDIDPARMGADGRGGLTVEARPDPRRG